MLSLDVSLVVDPGVKIVTSTEAVPTYNVILDTHEFGKHSFSCSYTHILCVNV